MASLFWLHWLFRACVFGREQANSPNTNRYPTEGITAEAYPTSDQYTETRRRFGLKSYDTDLAFKTPDGKVVHLKEANISSDELATLQEGKNIVREYLPEDPQGTARRQGDMMGVWIFLAIGVISLGFALAWFKGLFGKNLTH